MSFLKGFLRKLRGKELDQKPFLEEERLAEITKPILDDSEVIDVINQEKEQIRDVQQSVVLEEVTEDVLEQENVSSSFPKVQDEDTAIPETVVIEEDYVDVEVPERIEELVHSLLSGDDYRHQVEIIGDLYKEGPIALVALHRVLREGLGFQRVRAAWALEEMSDKLSVEPLILALDDEEKDVRKHAVKTLVKLGDKMAVDPLINLLNDTRSVKEVVVNALGKLGDQRAIEPLKRVLLEAEKEQLEELRVAASTALAKLGAFE